MFPRDNDIALLPIDGWAGRYTRVIVLEATILYARIRPCVLCCDGSEWPTSIVRAALLQPVAKRREPPIDPQHHGERSGWLCRCGHWESSCHNCGQCGNESPWLCTCAFCWGE